MWSTCCSVRCVVVVTCACGAWGGGVCGGGCGTGGGGGGGVHWWWCVRVCVRGGVRGGAWRDWLLVDIRRVISVTCVAVETPVVALCQIAPVTVLTAQLGMDVTG